MFFISKPIASVAIEKFINKMYLMLLTHILFNIHMKSLRIYFLVIFVFIIASLSCSSEETQFFPLHYFPVSEDNSWSFSGSISQIKIKSVKEEKNTKLVTLNYTDSLSILLWQEDYEIKDEHMYWKNFEPSVLLIPDISFEPPLPITPFSKKMGATKRLTTTEMQKDSLTRECSVQVDYEIMAVETVTTPAGTFSDCIKVKMSFKYLEMTATPYFLGDHIWWYAEGVGPVRYELPTEEGELVDIHIKRSIPTMQTFSR